MFKFEKELTEKELELEQVVIKLLAHKDSKKRVKLEVNKTNILIENEEKQLFILLDDTGITIQNTNFSTKERLGSTFLTRLKDLVIKNINQETDEALEKMVEKERKLIKNIQNLC